MVMETTWILKLVGHGALRAELVAGGEDVAAHGVNHVAEDLAERVEPALHGLKGRALRRVEPAGDALVVMVDHITISNGELRFPNEPEAVGRSALLDVQSAHGPLADAAAVGDDDLRVMLDGQRHELGADLLGIDAHQAAALRSALKLETNRFRLEGSSVSDSVFTHKTPWTGC